MKIRIKGNSVRFRLTRSEVEIFCREGYYEEQTVLIGNVFKYAVKALDNIEDLSADFQHNTITMYLPKGETKTWANDARVGFRHELLLDNGQKLSLLLEKDFVCMDERGEDESDNYPNPKLGKI